MTITSHEGDGRLDAAPLDVPRIDAGYAVQADEPQEPELRGVGAQASGRCGEHAE